MKSILTLFKNGLIIKVTFIQQGLFNRGCYQHPQIKLNDAIKHYELEKQNSIHLMIKM